MVSENALVWNNAQRRRYADLTTDSLSADTNKFCTLHRYCICHPYLSTSRSEWPSDLRREPAAANLLELRVWIPPEAWISCVLWVLFRHTILVLPQSYKTCKHIPISKCRCCTVTTVLYKTKCIERTRVKLSQGLIEHYIMHEWTWDTKRVSPRICHLESKHSASWHGHFASRERKSWYSLHNRLG
jgi:hypothetical protein